MDRFLPLLGVPQEAISLENKMLKEGIRLFLIEKSSWDLTFPAARFRKITGCWEIQMHGVRLLFQNLSRIVEQRVDILGGTWVLKLEALDLCLQHATTE